MRSHVIPEYGDDTQRVMTFGVDNGILSDPGIIGKRHGESLQD